MTAAKEPAPGQAQPQEQARSMPVAPRAAAIAGKFGSDLPVPQTVSPVMQDLLRLAPLAWWQDEPVTAEDWAVFKQKVADTVPNMVPDFLAAYEVSLHAETIARVPCFVLEPKALAPRNRHRVLLHLHGGGYALNDGELCVKEAIPLAGILQARIVCVDFRQLPEHAYPAPLDDSLAVYRALLAQYAPACIGVFGSSSGGALTLALPLRAMREQLPLPGALVAGTPWAEIEGIGDTSVTLEGTDTCLVSQEGFLAAAARAYAKGQDPKNPEISPLYGDFAGFPPTLLVAGTRDLFLSNTVRVHAKMLQSGVDARLLVHEGLPHCFYYALPDIPETRFHYDQLAHFFDRHLQGPAEGAG